MVLSALRFWLAFWLRLTQKIDLAGFRFGFLRWHGSDGEGAEFPLKTKHDPIAAVTILKGCHGNSLVTLQRESIITAILLPIFYQTRGKRERQGIMVLP